MEFKGTPGPWSYRKSGPHWNNSLLTNIEINFGSEGECIADTVYEEADARLISAAPELLEALQLIVAEHSGMNKSCGHNGYECTCGYDKARAAISKALGGE
ncbi:hypothetical protein HQN64_18940 [Enterobacteriaceae bacterium BIT-l23]|uniref:hypothetical protein n=1 Tax=Jejubacter sp. L23 TaxID=3092086 RepID=UPI0015855650|nr:hypothetical protein [Enterobacteriaceae bacterium BIT-l23]